MINFNLDKYKKSLETDYIGKNIIYLKKVDSTNNFASKLIKKRSDLKNSPLEGTVVLAETQEKGKGRLERVWISPEGGLWFTIILKTTLEEKNLPEVTLIAAYSIAAVLDAEYNIKTIIKWPNDIYYEKLKLGGILTEVEKIDSSIYLIIGIGINANLDTEDLAPFGKKSVSIKTIFGKDIERESFLSKILLDFERDYKYYSQTRDFKTLFKKIEKILNYD
ncbi:MAG: biotin--[acetyl-CoA-carboxylase] ligase [Actinobacteria bacterium]|jgi:BirA family biotin operon repressor/biotin-[acetyl-CoA-carboxylase] ligase|nr:biotin--[acetyl-CoA-carboxylase] ligase [Actinomycetota bacterium]